jgi:DNA replication licensing factor MCM3
LPNGTHLRGDINILMIGDPSCGKSQMLRFVMNTAPLAISTTGRGSSGVGLTAAITKEPGSREFQLEAGAMVLADRGFICIDEFDKMGANDRVAIHEAMEQQCVTIAKAGMHVTLNARCSVVAAANPVYGSFDPSLDLAKNIGMPDSLLSRFDLVFVVRDVTTEETDRKIASQVIRQAQLRLGMEDGKRRGVEQVHSSILQRRLESDRQREQEATEVFEKMAQSAEGDERPEVCTVDFLRKYLRYCRRFTPILSAEAQAEVADRYVDMRMRFQSGYAEQFDGASSASKKPRLAVTTRTLEALIRLATAHAKLKLRKEEVLKEDVTEAYKLMLEAREEEVSPSMQAPPPAPGSGPAPVAMSDEPQAKRRSFKSKT